MAIRETLEREVKLRACEDFTLPELGGEAIEPRLFVCAGHDVLDPEWAESLREELGWLGGALGPVRDLDVLLEHLTGEVESLGSDATEGRKLLRTLDPDAPDDDLHAARIKVKRARYAAELCGHSAYVKSAKTLQDVLGEHQDAVVAAERLRALAARQPAGAIAAGRLVEREQARACRGRDQWEVAWKRLAKTA